MIFFNPEPTEREQELFDEVQQLRALLKHQQKELDQLNQAFQTQLREAQELRYHFEKMYNELRTK